MDFKGVDFCAMMNGKSWSNRFAKSIIFDSIKKYKPTFFHKCPYIGIQDLKNISVSNTYMTLYPHGSYRIKALVNVTETFIATLKLTTLLHIIP